MQLALSMAFLITAVLFFVFKNYLEFFPFGDYLFLILVVCALYCIGLLLGCKILYPKEYLIINSRKIKYKTGWRNREVKIYLKDILKMEIKSQQLILKLKNRDVQQIDLSKLSPSAISILKNYLDIEE
jgi:amino acid permease